MSHAYNVRRSELIRQVDALKSIYKFRIFLYSLNRDVRQRCFEICREYLQNELENIELNISERDRVIQLLNHFQWNEFDQHSTLWWSILSFNYVNSITLIYLINIWTSDLTIAETNIRDDISLGLR